jgi:hypothetical protein
MVDAVVGAAAVFGLVAAGVEIRRRLKIRARIARRLTSMAGPFAGHLFRPALAQEADAA